MPATRSRTENWRQSLQQICERNGALEITLPRYVEDVPPEEGTERDEHGMKNLIWRVRILSVTDDEIMIEEPMTLGAIVPLEPGIDLVGIIVVGQNRWMFRTVLRGYTTTKLNREREVRAIRLAMPQTVERCQRRNFYRISTVGLDLPDVDTYLLTDAASAAVAEQANRVRIQTLQDGGEIEGSPARDDPVEPILLPKVGPVIKSKLVNIGGGGVGLLIEPNDRVTLEAGMLLWLRIGLQPQIPIPLCVSARLRHTHIDSSQRLYAGVAFEFGHNPGHEKFVVDQLCRYVATLQREQLRRKMAG